MILTVHGSYQILLYSNCEKFFPVSGVPLGSTLEVTLLLLECHIWNVLGSVPFLGVVQFFIA